MLKTCEPMVLMRLEKEEALIWSTTVVSLTTFVPFINVT